MIEILFRGKRTDTGEWVEGSLIRYADGCNFICVQSENVDILNKFEVIPETVGQYTGLHNFAEQKIFDGDIVRFEDELYRVRREDETPGGYWASTAYILQRIGWDYYMSFVDTIDGYYNEICVEIIGNIHDNPELIGGK